MKALVVLLTLLAGVWLVKRSIRRRQADLAAPMHKPPARPAAKQQPMLACARCGVHAPAHDMVQNQHGHFCSAAHQQAHQQSLRQIQRQGQRPDHGPSR